MDGVSPYIILVEKPPAYWGYAGVGGVMPQREDPRGDAQETKPRLPGDDTAMKSFVAMAKDVPQVTQN
jgi:hypothetical protein